MFDQRLCVTTETYCSLTLFLT